MLFYFVFIEMASLKVLHMLNTKKNHRPVELY